MFHSKYHDLGGGLVLPGTSYLRSEKYSVEIIRYHSPTHLSPRTIVRCLHPEDRGRQRDSRTKEGDDRRDTTLLVSPTVDFLGSRVRRLGPVYCVGLSMVVNGRVGRKSQSDALRSNPRRQINRSISPSFTSDQSTRVTSSTSRA